MRVALRRRGRVAVAVLRDRRPRSRPSKACVRRPRGRVPLDALGAPVGARSGGSAAARRDLRHLMAARSRPPQAEAPRRGAPVVRGDAPTLTLGQVRGQDRVRLVERRRCGRSDGRPHRRLRGGGRVSTRRWGRGRGTRFGRLGGGGDRDRELATVLVPVHAPGLDGRLRARGRRRLDGPRCRRDDAGAAIEDARSGTVFASRVPSPRERASGGPLRIVGRALRAAGLGSARGSGRDRRAGGRRRRPARAREAARARGRAPRAWLRERHPGRVGRSRRPRPFPARGRMPGLRRARRARAEAR